ncbi:MAG: hypothetical protein AAF487_14230 [Bacteroidota bacterium]
MNEKKIVINSRYFVWRFQNGDDPSDQIQKGIQAFIKRHDTNPHLVLVPEGLNLLPPMSGFEVEQNALVPPFRFYFAVTVD